MSKVNGGGEAVSLDEAKKLLRSGEIAEIMVYQYGAINCDECIDKEECTCWTGCTVEDLGEDGDGLDDYKHFEIW